MKLSCSILAIFLLACMPGYLISQELSITGNQFFLNGESFDMWGIRVASAAQHDTLTEALIQSLDEYKSYKVNTVSIYIQGSSGGYSDPFSANGKKIESGQIYRLVKIIQACAQQDMVVIAGIFYQRVMGNHDQTLNLRNENAVRNATRLFTEILKPYRNVIINIANEHNSSLYHPFRPFDFNDPSNIISLCKEVKKIDPQRIVGAGGYHDSSNVVIGKSSVVDVLLFDTYAKDVEQHHHSGWHYDYFREKGVPDKPIVNVEIFGGWTRQFAPQGVYTEEGKSIHIQEIIEAQKRPGLYVCFHSNRWCQGPADGEPIRYELGGNGTKRDPGIRWWFEAVKNR